MKKISFFLIIMILPIMVFAEKIDFKRISYYGEFQVDAHYIITVYNPNDNNWYALGVGDSGDAVSVEIDNPKNGLKIGEESIKELNYIFVGSKKPANKTIKLKSNIVDENSGKKYSLYLNKSLLNTGGGDIKLNRAGFAVDYSYYSFSYRNSNFLFYDKTTNTFGYGARPDSYYAYDMNGIVNGYMDSNSNVTYYFYVFTDLEQVEDNIEEVKLYKTPTIGSTSDILYYLNRKDKVQFVYTSGNDKYILTSDGAKKVNITNDELVTKDYMTLDYNENYYTDNDAFINGFNFSNTSLVNQMKDVSNGWNSRFYTNFIISFQHKYNYLDLSSEYNLFNDDNYYYYTDSIYVYFKTPFSNNLFTDRIVNPVSDEDYLDVAFNEPAKFKICNYYIAYSYNSTDIRCIGWDSKTNSFVKVNNIANAVLFEIYSSREILEKTNVELYGPDGVLNYTLTTVTDHDLYNINNKRYAYMNSNGTVTINNNEYRFLGFTDDPTKVGIVKNEDNENILDYNKKTKRVEVTSEFKEKYSIVSKLSEAKKENGVIKLYPVLFNNNAINYVYFGKDEKRNSIIAVTDWKDVQTEYDSLNHAKYDINQGTINIEVYKDGKLWLNRDKVYYKYHNDNAADLLIKFIDMDIPDTQLEGYVKSKDDFRPSANKLYIVGIYAQQGSSEEGLYMEFNAANENGAMLDNVKGGSTVKIYLSTKYTLKYYLDDVLYRSDNLKYVPTVTKILINDNSDNSNYVVNDNENKELLNLTGDNNYLDEDNLERGEYSSFSYELSSLLDTAEVFELPKEDLLYQFWAIKDENGEINNKALPKEFVQLLTMDNLDYLFLGDNDEINTIHLYAYTKKYKNAPKIDGNKLTKISEGEKELIVPKKENIVLDETGKYIIAKEDSKNPKTMDAIKLVVLLLLISAIFLITINHKKNISFKLKSK